MSVSVIKIYGLRTYSDGSMLRICLAGTPPTMVFAGMLLVTTDPAAMMTLSPMVTP